MSERPVGLIDPPVGYADWLADLKGRIHSAQQRATLAVNRELVLLYWQIGKDILQRQAAQGWSAKVIERLALDLRAAFPEMKGFSPRNLKYMRAFAESRTRHLCKGCLHNCCSNPCLPSCKPACPASSRLSASWQAAACCRTVMKAKMLLKNELPALDA